MCGHGFSCSRDGELFINAASQEYDLSSLSSLLGVLSVLSVTLPLHRAEKIITHPLFKHSHLYYDALCRCCPILV